MLSTIRGPGVTPPAFLPHVVIRSQVQVPSQYQTDIHTSGMNADMTTTPSMIPRAEAAVAPLFVSAGVLDRSVKPITRTWSEIRRAGLYALEDGAA